MHFFAGGAGSFHKIQLFTLSAGIYCSHNLNTTCTEKLKIFIITSIIIIIISSSIIIHLLLVKAILSFSKNEAATDDARLVGTFTLSDSDCVRFSFRFSLTTVLNEGYYDCGRLNDVDVYK